MSLAPDSAAGFLAAAREILPWMTEIRRDLHQHPELGLEEHRTAEVDIERANAAALSGEDNVEVLPKPNMGVEDFGCYVSHVPGAFFSIGVRNEAKGIVNPVHHVLFDADEEAMAYGAAIQVMNALTLLAG